MNGLPGHQRAHIILPAGIARRMCGLAREEWGDEAEERAGWGVSRIRMWLGGTAAHRRDSRSDQRPFGAFSVRWGEPQPSLAVIEKIEWDPIQGASEEEIRHAVDHLAGWPVATRDRIRR